MTPYRVTFESPLELSAQGEFPGRLAASGRIREPRPESWPFFFCPGKQMIETYFDFRLYRLWKSRQHSKLLDFEDVL